METHNDVEESSVGFGRHGRFGWYCNANSIHPSGCCTQRMPQSREGKISNDRRSDRLFLKGEKDYIPSDRDSSLAGYIIAMGVLVGITVLVVRACEGSV